MSKRPEIYKYHDYRAFLKEAISVLQEKDQEMSLRQISKKCEFAVGYLPMVLSGKRNLSEKAVDALKKPLKLKPDEVSYLKYMIVMNDTDSREEKLEALKKMQKFHRYTSENSNELEAYKYLTRWQHVALREMVLLEGFQNDLEWIKEKLLFSTSPKDISEGLEFLIKNNFIEKNPSGKLQVKDKMLDCFEGIYRLSLGEFYKQVFQLAIEAIDSVPRNERMLLGHTFAVSTESFEKISAVLNEALEKIRTIEKKDASKDRVYQVTFSAFPLTKKGAP